MKNLDIASLSLHEVNLVLVCTYTLFLMYMVNCIDSGTIHCPVLGSVTYHCPLAKREMPTHTTISASILQSV